MSFKVNKVSRTLSKLWNDIYQSSHQWTFYDNIYSISILTSDFEFEKKYSDSSFTASEYV
jgi:hypothetical protein